MLPTMCVCVLCCSNSSVFKSVEEKVGGAYTSVKVRIHLQLHNATSCNYFELVKLHFRQFHLGILSEQ